MNSIFDMENIDIAWCPGCGDFSILNILKKTLTELDLKPKDLVFVSGIGQAAKIPHYFKTNVFNGLHGRALPAATAIKAVNPELTVIAESGDGCMYGEGGNHFIHTVRRNPGITHIVHNNMIYGLTKGQASPTTPIGFKTSIQVDGVYEEPFNPLAVAISLGASFVARAFAGDIQQTKEIIKKAIKHKGYALIDIFQPCVSFNKINTYQWYKENTYYLGEDYTPNDKVKAFEVATKEGKFALGILYINPTKTTFEENLPAYESVKKPLYQRETDFSKILSLIESKRG